MPMAQVDDIKIFYNVLGNGFPLLMIHGLNDISDNWNRSLIRGLSEKFKLVLFDVPGSGRSELSNKEPSIKLFAEETSSLMDTIGITKAHVLGLSLGGMIAQELVLNYPEKVEKLVLCSTHCGGSRRINPSMKTTPKVQKVTANIAGLSPEDVVRNSVRFLFTGEFIRNNLGYIEDHIKRRLSAPASKKGLMGQQKAAMSFSSCERLHMINVPTLILHGRKDIGIPPENGLVLAEAIPNAKLVFLENSAHYLAEDADKVLETIMNFLD
ncbi:MAG: alpha/beta hydrolase [Candidatus Bathyarchaeota archaeon]|nr:alpha/beta hydrolase [Candidatus Bathyarchaeota archaeon]